MKKIFKSIFKGLCESSTKPEISSYKWAMRERSIFASVLLWFMWVCRVLSLYQNVKLIYRIIGKKVGFGYTENSSGRPDVPPWLGELYFLSFTILFSVAHIFDVSGKWIQIVAIYYLFESSLWVLYYTVFRRFFEMGYTIYHQLEYITTIILIIPTQAICFSHIYSISFYEVLRAILGSSGENTPILITVFGYMLTAIVIGMIIANFPAENIKKCEKKAKMLIIGCGDVVRSRLYPAIVNSGLSIDTVMYDLSNASGNNQMPICNYLESPQKIMEEVRKDISNNSIIWIETPPDSHLYYIEQCLKTKARLIVVEKPIIYNENELTRLNEILNNPKKRSRLFFLSYYALEKALPLYYLSALASEQKNDVSRSKVYEKYLNIEGRNAIKNWQSLLGKLKTVDVQIFEGKDLREWVAGDSLGGHLFETFLHNLLIAEMFCGPVNKWKIKEFSDADYTQSTHEISMKALCEDVEISLFVKKNWKLKQRTANLVFENGTITADFDKKIATVSFEQLKISFEIGVLDEYARNYSVLTDLVGVVHSGKYSAEDVDGLKNQLEALQLLWNIKKT